MLAAEQLHGRFRQRHQGGRSPALDNAVQAVEVASSILTKPAHYIAASLRYLAYTCSEWVKSASDHPSLGIDCKCTVADFWQTDGVLGGRPLQLT
jgi:hypothetical protein